MKKAFRPFLISLVVVASIYLGSRLIPTDDHLLFPSKSLSGINKLNEILNYIEESYVDSVEKEKLIEDGIESMLKDLDPHSYYIPKEKFRDIHESLEGNFEGIGVEFRIIDDTIMVIAAIPNGPSEKAGIKAGDRLVSVNDSVIAGVGIRNKDVIKLLKGPRETSVIVGIRRDNEEVLQQVEIVRGRIPINSIQSSYMLNENMGYIKVDRFSKNTFSEFKNATDLLLDQGMNRYIIDLRGNPGGLLNQAISMANEFLKHDLIIVYTEGKARPKKIYYADNQGSLLHVPLVVILDEGSASASEVFAGAIQDNDRGLIVGRRSFGKGLVQEQVDWPDGSALRLTVARYYTPTGRSIQKPYKGVEDYHLETYGRIQNGELDNADSIHVNDTLKFYTQGGRVVYGGGGIVPDEFISVDSLLYNQYYNNLYRTGSFQNFAFRFADSRRMKLLGQYPNWSSFNSNFHWTEVDFNAFLEFATQRGAIGDPKMAAVLKEKISTDLKAQCARHLYGDPGYYPILNQSDLSITKAMSLLK